MAVPSLSSEQKKAALKKAQELRSRRARLRRELKTGYITLKEVLGRSSDDEAVSRMRVAYLLESLPRIGRTRSQKIMDELGIHESRRVQGLGTRQRKRLLERLGT